MWASNPQSSLGPEQKKKVAEGGIQPFSLLLPACLLELGRQSLPALELGLTPCSRAFRLDLDYTTDFPCFLLADSRS